MLRRQKLNSSTADAWLSWVLGILLSALNGSRASLVALTRRLQCPVPRRTDSHATDRPRLHGRTAGNWPGERLPSRACPPHALRCRDHLGSVDGKKEGCSRGGGGHCRRCTGSLKPKRPSPRHLRYKKGHSRRSGPKSWEETPLGGLQNRDAIATPHHRPTHLHRSEQPPAGCV